jgi:enamine deaminase RidA (YjgF/YER057c/UK114 family)
VARSLAFIYRRKLCHHLKDQFAIAQNIIVPIQLYVLPGDCQMEEMQMTGTAGPIDKKLAYLGAPWEEAFGYAQAVQVSRTIYVSGQLSHDDTGKLVGPAPLDAARKILDASNMELQMRTSLRTR